MKELMTKVKVTLDFESMDDPEFKAFVKANDQSAVLWELATFLRNKVKYAEDSGESNKWQEFQTEFWRICKEFNLDPMS
jgi:hypothetical protein